MAVNEMRVVPFSGGDRGMPQQKLHAANVCAFGKQVNRKRISKLMRMQTLDSGYLTQPGNHPVQALRHTGQSTFARPKKVLTVAHRQSQQHLDYLWRELYFDRRSAAGFLRSECQQSGFRIQRRTPKASHIAEAHAAVQQKMNQHSGPLLTESPMRIQARAAVAKRVAGADDSAHFIVTERRCAEQRLLRSWNSFRRVTCNPAAWLGSAPSEEDLQNCQFEQPGIGGQMLPLDGAVTVNDLFADRAERHVADGLDQSAHSFLVAANSTRREIKVRVLDMLLPLNCGFADGKRNFDAPVDAAQQIVPLAISHGDVAGFEAVADGFVGAVDAAPYPDRALANTREALAARHADFGVPPVGCQGVRHAFRVAFWYTALVHGAKNSKNPNDLQLAKIFRLSTQVLKTLSFQQLTRGLKYTERPKYPLLVHACTGIPA